MDVATIDNAFQQLQLEADQAVQAIQTLAQKLQTAAQAGDTNAREWLLDLREVTLRIQQEQIQTQALLQALHGYTVNTLQQLPAAPEPYAQPPAQVGYLQGAPQGGGRLNHFMGSGFGQAMTQGMGMGAGFGIAEGLIDSIFRR